MSALDFPDNPAVGDSYGSSSTRWRWNGTLWESTGGASGARGEVAYAQIIASIAGYGASNVDIYGLRVTFNAVAGRRYKITGHVYCSAASANSVGNTSIMTDAGSQVQSAVVSMPSPGVPFKSHNEYVFTATTTGPLTYKMMASLVSGASAMVVEAQPYYPAFILVEDITYEAGTSGVSNQPTAWVPMTLLNGWTIYTPSPPMYRKVGDIVYCRGYVTQGATPNTSPFFNMPAGFRSATVEEVKASGYANGRISPSLAYYPDGNLLAADTVAAGGSVDISPIIYSITP